MRPPLAFFIEEFHGVLLTTANQMGFHYAAFFPSIHFEISSSRNNSVWPILWWGIAPT
jgi:hypothetical protein